MDHLSQESPPTWSPGEAAVLAAADEGRAILLALGGPALEAVKPWPSAAIVFRFSSGIAVVRVLATGEGVRALVELGGVLHVQVDDGESHRLPREVEEESP